MAYKKKAFTIVELIIAIVVMSIVVGVVYYIYTSSLKTYVVVAWKQERLSKMQYLLKTLKEDLSEASPKVEMSAGVATISDSPLKYRASGSGSKLLEFNRHHFNDSSTLAYIIKCTLELNTKTLKYTRTKDSGSPPPFAMQPSSIELEDVESVEIEVKHIVFDKDSGYEYLIEGTPSASEEKCGTMLNLSFILVPPTNIQIKAPLIETFKQRLYIQSESL